MDLFLFFGARFGGIEVVKWCFMTLMLVTVVDSLLACIGSENILSHLIDATEFLIILVVLLFLGAPTVGVIWTLFAVQIISMVIYIVIGAIPISPIIMTVLNIVGIILFYINGLV